MRRILALLVFASELFELVAFITLLGNARRVADEDYTFSLICEIAEDLHYLVLSFTVEVTRRLVCEYDLGIVGDGSRYSDTLLLTRIFLVILEIITYRAKGRLKKREGR